MSLSLACGSTYQAYVDDGWDMAKFKNDSEKMRKKAARKLSRAQREKAQQLVNE